MIYGVNDGVEYCGKVKKIKKHLPDGWYIEMPTERSTSGTISFTLNKDGVSIASGLDGTDIWPPRHNYNMAITGYSIYDAKPIVDKIMDEYKSSVKKEQLEQEERSRINREIASKNAFDKRQKEVRTVLGFPLDGPVVEYNDVVDCKTVEVKSRSIFSRIFG